MASIAGSTAVAFYTIHLRARNLRLIGIAARCNFRTRAKLHRRRTSERTPLLSLSLSLSLSSPISLHHSPALSLSLSLALSLSGSDARSCSQHGRACTGMSIPREADVNSTKSLLRRGRGRRIRRFYKALAALSPVRAGEKSR